MGKKEFRQGYRLIGRGLAPVVQLRGEDDHLIVILNGFHAEVFDHIGSDTLEIQSLPSWKRYKQSIRLRTIVGFRYVTGIVDISVLRRMQDIVIDKPSLHFFADRDLTRHGVRYSRSSPCSHESTASFVLSFPTSSPRTASPSRTVAFDSSSLISL